MEDLKNILITGAGSPGGPGIINCLLRHKSLFNLFICDADNEASGKYLLPLNFRLIKKADDPQFINDFLNLCIKEDINIVLPLVTKELFVLSKAKEEFKKQGIQIIVSDFQSLRIINDKGLLYSRLDEKGIDVPKYYFINNSDELINNSIKLGYPDKPIVIKPRVSNGSRGVRIIDNKIDKLDLLLNQKPDSLYTTLDDLKNTINGRKIPPLILTEFLPGPEITIDTIIKDQKIELILIRTRDRMRSGISIKGKFIKDKKIELYIKEIIGSFKGLEGPIGFQLKRNKDNKFLLLECNPRIQGTSVSSLGLGINFPLSIINSKIGKARSNHIKTSGISFSRFYDQIYYES